MDQQVGDDNQIAEREIAAMASAILGLPASAIARDTDLILAGMDSLRVVEFMLSLERRFSVSFPETMLETDRFRTVAMVVETVSNSNGRPVACDFRSPPP
jgi:acyl carrier protein